MSEAVKKGCWGSLSMFAMVLQLRFLPHPSVCILIPSG